MTVYFVDDGGSGTDPFDTWAKAATSIQALDTAKALASGDIIYVGADSNCTDAAAALSITGPASGLPITIISSTVGAGATVSYSVGTGDQILALGATSDVTFNGAFSLHGIRVRVGRSVIIDSDGNENFYSNNCTFALGAGGTLQGVVTNISSSRHSNLTIDLTADGTTPTATAVITPSVGAHGNIEFTGTVFTNPAYRTGSIISAGTGIGTIKFSGSDLSGFDVGCELLNLSSSFQHYISNCKTVSGFAAYVASPVITQMGCMLMTNVGPTDAPSALWQLDYFGITRSSTAIYRTGGADVEGEACSWLISTSVVSACSEYSPYYTPWIYDVISSTGNKTVSVAVTHDNVAPVAALFTDAQVWLEVEFLATSDSPQWSLATDHRATITTTAANQTTDATSTWNGSGPTFAHKQTLSVPITVGETGQVRARVAVGVNAITTAANFYVDPTVTVADA